MALWRSEFETIFGMTLYKVEMGRIVIFPENGYPATVVTYDS